MDISIKKDKQIEYKTVPLIIVTVGISMVQNLIGADEVGTLYRTTCSRIVNNISNCQNQGQLVEFLERLAKGAADQVARRDNGGDQKDLLSQELSYLYLWKERNQGKKADLLLLSSKSYSGIFCAKTISEIVQKYWGKVFTLIDNGSKGVEIIDGLDGANAQFTQTAVPSLVKTITKYAINYKKVIMNPTGGFKGIIPYCTLALHALEDKQVEMNYLYEKSTEIEILPCYPVGLEFIRWHQEHALLDMCVNAPEGAVWRDRYLSSLDNRMRTVCDEMCRNRTDSNITLSQLYQNQYKQLLSKDLLQVFSKRVLDQFLPNDTLDESGKAWKDSLSILLSRVGSLIWQGDKLPMAANHASQHHHNLLRFAQMLLTPIIDEVIPGRAQNNNENNNQKFLNNTERIALFAAIMLHDCGHSLDRLKYDEKSPEIPLFRSEIRELHHYLAYYRLKENLLQKTLEWEPPKDQDDLWDDICMLCYYHRSATEWDDESKKKDRIVYIDKQFPLPTKWQPKRNDIDPLKLVALIRFIDGCDNQTLRVGGGNAWESIERQLEYDKETWKVRLQEALALINLISNDCNVEGDKCFISKMRAHLANESTEIPSVDWDLRMEAVKQIVKADKNCAFWRAWLELARICDEYKVRYGQKVHFLKHAVVDDIQIQPTSDFNNKTWDFCVYLHNQDRSLFDKITTEKYKDNQTVKEWIEEEITKELGKKQKDYLSGISGRTFSVNYVWILPDGSKKGFTIKEPIDE